MSYFVSFIDGDDNIHDGDDLASTAGLAAFQAWAAELPADDYPELAYVGEFGETENVSDLQAELERIDARLPAGPVADVARRLLAALRDRPVGAVGMAITDGTGEDDEDVG
jgi:hypothetical protein